jgi:tight adherence protein C
MTFEDALTSQWVRALILFCVFAAVALAAWILSAYAGSRIAIQRRLAGRGEASQAAPGASLRQAQAQTAWVRLVNAIEQSGISLVDTKSDALREKLRAAGYSSPDAPRLYTLIRLVMTLGLPGAYVGLMAWTGSSPSLFKMYLIGVLLACLGLYLPNLWISAKASRRQQEIINGFPDALDLMLVCVEAGLALEAAFSRVGAEMTRSHPLLADVYATVVLELRAGRSREEALRRMADRAGVEEIRAFATLLIQSDKLGSSVAQTLRVYAAEMRERRRMRAEEKAHRLPVLLSVPLVACMLPTMIGVLMLPAVIRVVRTLIPAMTR